MDQEAIVLRAVRAGLAGLSDDDFRSVERLVRCFRVPRVDHAWLVLRAIDRLFREVPWAPELRALEDLAGLLHRIRPRLDELQYKAGEPSTLEEELRGDFLGSGSLVKPQNVSSAEAFRLVLVASSWVWVEGGEERKTALAVLSQAIRGLDKLAKETLNNSATLRDNAASLPG